MLGNSIVAVIVLAVLAGIVFVQAGRLGGKNGGDQTGTIIKASGTGLSQVISAIETGGVGSAT